MLIGGERVMKLLFPQVNNQVHMVYATIPLTLYIVNTTYLMTHIIKYSQMTVGILLHGHPIHRETWQ